MAKTNGHDATGIEEARRIRVAVRHALLDDQGVLWVELPARAKFKHLKCAVDRHVGTDECQKTGMLVTKNHKGSYLQFRDEDSIMAELGETREVFLIRAGLGLKAGSASAEVSLEDGEVSGAEAEAEALEEVAAAAAKPKLKSSLTRDQAVSLQKELLEGYQDPDFQRQLVALNGTRDVDATFFSQERQKLFLTVQGAVLPRYGFEGTQRGVYKMMGEWGPFVEDPECQRLHTEISQVLGLDMPLNTVERRVAAFQKMSSEKSEAREAAAAKGDSASTTVKEEEKAWPAEKPAPFRLFIAGTWNSWRPEEMTWEMGCFWFRLSVGKHRYEAFQLLVEADWEKVYYPSNANASTEETWTVCGPDEKGKGKRWMIGKPRVEKAAAGSQFEVVAALSGKGAVVDICWQQLRGKA